MSPRQATIYQLWCGEKLFAGEHLTESELSKMREARDTTIGLAYRLMRVKPSDHVYVPGQSFL